MHALAGKRVLIVEDNGLIGEVIAETISNAGGLPLGPVMSEIEALDMINYNPGVPDAAVVDIGIDGSSFGVADRLHDLGVPFVFATGEASGIPGHLRNAEVCLKPYSRHELLGALNKALLVARD